MTSIQEDSRITTDMATISDEQDSAHANLHLRASRMSKRSNRVDPPAMPQLSNQPQPGEGATVPRKRKFSERLGDELVRIEVGTGECKYTFSVHKQLLSEKAQVFAKMFSGGFQEAETSFASLPEDLPYAFDAFVEWLYCGTISAVTVEDRHELLGVSHFASKYLLEELADRSLTEFINIERMHSQMPSCKLIARYYALTPESSKIRQYLVEMASWLIVNLGHEGVGGRYWKTEDFGEMFKQDDDLMIDVLKGLRATAKSGRRIRDPRDAPKCDFHQHEKGPSCPYEQDLAIRKFISLEHLRDGNWYPHLMAS